MQADVGFDLQRVCQETFVADVVYHQTIDSTNNAALEHCQRDDLRPPLLVIASQQTSGRGRGANRWWSTSGGLTFSLVIRAADLGLAPHLWPRASLTTGLSVCAALELLLPRAEISLKWPNDVHLEGRKVCGVLVEVGPWASDLLVLGIGVNVNNSLELAPDELKSIATSLIDFTGRHLELTEVLICVLRQLEIQLARLGGGDPGLAADWHSRCVLRGRTVAVDSGARTTIGVCQGIDEEGALVLLTEGGPARLFGGVVAGIW